MIRYLREETAKNMGALRNRIRLLNEFKKIDQHLRESELHEKLASQSVFDAAGWTAHVSSQLEPGFSYLIYAAHRHFLDSCAANLVLPNSCRCKRIVNAQVAKSFGPQYQRHNFATLARFRWRWLFRNCYDWTSRFFYCASSGWFRSVPTETHEIVQWIRAGNSLITFPTGVFGSARWRRGLGQLIHDYLEHHDEYRLPLKLVGLKIDYCFTQNQVNVDVVSVVPTDSLRSVVSVSSETPVDIRLTESLEQEYANEITQQR